MKKTLTIILLFVFTICQAQVKQDLRVELPADDPDGTFQAISFGKEGLISFRGEKTSKKSTRWIFTRMDVNQKQVDSTAFEMPRMLRFREYRVLQERVAFLFVCESRRAFQIVMLNFNTMQTEKINGNLAAKAFVEDMCLIGDYVFLEQMTKRTPILIIVNLQSKISRKLPLKVQGASRVWTMGLETVGDGNEALIYLGCRMKSKNATIQVQHWSKEGQMTRKYFISDNDINNITSLTGSLVSGDRMIFCGTYSGKSSSKGAGYFVASFTDGERDFIRYYNFLDLENFTNYLTERKQKKLDRKKKRKEAHGNTMELNLWFVPHQVIELNHQFYFICEFYFPTYRTVTTTTYINGRPSTTTHTYFDGYQYTHASLICFDRDGNKLWDNTFELFPAYKPFSVIRFVAANVQPEGKVDLMYSSMNRLFSRSFDSQGKIVKSTNVEGIDTGGEDEKTKRTISSIEYWYDNHFLAYGMQRIKNREKADKPKKRDVFFINKVSTE
ncbi:MAG TPA: hypothetical protein P5228_00385 [Bacteroidales bacterium]|nr:hypothetical protein [Bacteroidales bacterium]HRZ47887.1 hypothetical protein [Bacteroidales bacterium]